MRCKRLIVRSRAIAAVGRASLAMRWRVLDDGDSVLDRPCPYAEFLGGLLVGPAGAFSFARCRAKLASNIRRLVAYAAPGSPVHQRVVDFIPTALTNQNK